MIVFLLCTGFWSCEPLATFKSTGTVQSIVEAKRACEAELATLREALPGAACQAAKQ